MKHILKKSSLLFLVMSLLLLASACGNRNGNESKKDTDNTPKETITFKADNGDITVPKNPQRVIILADSYTGYFLKLGIKPIATQKLSLDNPYFAGMLDGTEEVTSDALEKITALKPDLIVTGTTDKNIKQLEKIAPTVAFEWGKQNYLQTLTTIGKLANKEKEANDWLNDWNKKVEANKGKIQAAVGDKTVSIMETFSKGVYVFGKNFGRGGEVIYDAFKLKAPAKVQTDVIEKAGFAEVSLEVIPNYAGDYIFFGKWAGEQTQSDKVENSSVWQGLPAVKNGHVYPLDPRTSFFSDPISLEKTMDFVVKSLTGSK